MSDGQSEANEAQYEWKRTPEEKARFARLIAIREEMATATGELWQKLYQEREALLDVIEDDSKRTNGTSPGL